MKTTGKRKERQVGERGLPVWPRRKPVPEFKTEAEESEWWNSYDHELPSDDAWEAVSYQPQATRQPRAHVYRVRFDDFEMAVLQALALNRGVSASVVLRELVRAKAAEVRLSSGDTRKTVSDAGIAARARSPGRPRKR